MNSKNTSLLKDLEKIISTLRPFSNDENIANALIGINQAIEHLSPKNNILQDGNGSEKNTVELITARGNKVKIDFYDTELAATGYHSFVIAPTRIGMSAIAALAEIQKNPNCYAFWGLKFAANNIQEIKPKKYERFIR